MHTSRKDRQRQRAPQLAPSAPTTQAPVFGDHLPATGLGERTEAATGAETTALGLLMTVDRALSEAGISGIAERVFSGNHGFQAAIEAAEALATPDALAVSRHERGPARADADRVVSLLAHSTGAPLPQRSRRASKPPWAWTPRGFASTPGPEPRRRRGS